MEFKHCKLRMELLAQSPMVHFQAEETGATLRGSELKPKLDRFLLKKVVGQELPDSAYANKEKQALNYKVTIEAIGEGEILDLSSEEGKRKFEFIFGNRKLKLVKRDAQLTIICMNSALQKLISENIVEFFATTNFGYRQKKGFGSFIPKEYLEHVNGKNKELIHEVAGWIKTSCKASKCYYMDFSSKNNDDRKKTLVFYNNYFKEMKDFYDLLKTGRNFRGYSRSYLFQYMHQKGIDNEKAWMKANGIAPVLEEKHHSKPSNPSRYKNARYVRALLGTGSFVEFKNASEFHDKVHVDIYNKDIERADSPIFFKIVSNYVFICSEQIEKDLYNKEFIFDSTNKEKWLIKGSENNLILKRGNSGKITVPSKKELEDVNFSIDDLLEQYVKFYNNEIPGEDRKKLRDKMKALSENVLVKEAR